MYSHMTVRFECNNHCYYTFICIIEFISVGNMFFKWLTSTQLIYFNLGPYHFYQLLGVHGIATIVEKVQGEKENKFSIINTI